ncbi:MAG: DNA translocase FtsK [Kiritimatiellae bacterium]|nr:DNA translocase FtsK [Kiritimatiellia bacterium]
MKNLPETAQALINGKRTFIGLLFFPISLFPLAALLTYDSSSMPQIQIPTTASTNWIGPIGDYFSFYGYSLLGLAIWIIPIYCIIIGCRSVYGASLRPKMIIIWRISLVLSAACLIELLAVNAPKIQEIQSFINIENAGGAVGFFITTKVLMPLFGNIGTSILLQILLVVSLLGAIGIANIKAFLKFLYKWAIGSSDEFDPGEAKPGTPEYEESRKRYEMIQLAREEAARQKEEEKLRIQQQKEELKRKKEEQKRLKEEAKRQQEREILEREYGSQNQEQDNYSTNLVQPLAQKPVSKANDKLNKQSQNTNQTSDDNTEFTPYILPSVNLLAPLKKSEADHSDVAGMSQKLIDTLKLFGLNTTLAYTVQGPVVTKYAISPEPGTRPEKFTALHATLMMALKAKSLRIEAPIPGEDKIGIEVPNRKPAGISFREIFESDEWKTSNAELPLLFGKRADGKELVADLASMPHMLVAGATGQGKSVCLNSLICGLLMTRTPEQLKLIMVDPKSVEFTPYSSIPHLLVPVITDNQKVVVSLNWAVAEMEKRLKMFARARVRNIYDFNHRKTITQTDMFGNDSELNSDMPKTVPYIVIIIDEAADLIGQCGKEVNPNIQRITQKARAAGIHIILATQRPDAKIITGTIKANIPGRVAFKTSQAIDSRTILDESGAENLIGRGDMLFRGKDGLLIRAQGAWISDDEIMNITEFIEQHSKPQFDEIFTSKLNRVKEAAILDPFAGIDDDSETKAENKAAQREMVKAAAKADDFKKAIECVINTKRASVSHFQRQMGWGYNHAAKILDLLTERGVVSPPQGMGPRQIVMDEDQLIKLLNEGDETNDNTSENDLGSNEAVAETEFTEDNI